MSRPVSSLAVLLGLAFAAPALAAGPGKADICHWSAGTAQVISVSVNAVPSHFQNHGDSYAAVYFQDADGDGFGAGTTDRCPNAGFVANNKDCNDSNAAINPGATEVPYDGVDNDCATGTADDDLDNDGFGIVDDCADDDAEINPDAVDVCDDGVDNNCSNEIDENCAVEGDCPCFGTAEIDARYAAWLADAQMDADYHDQQAQCYSHDYSYSSSYWNYSYIESYSSLWFYSFFGDYSGNYYNDWESYEGSQTGFYGLEYVNEYDGYRDAGAYCNAYSNDYTWDGSTYTDNRTHAFQLVTDAQAEACEVLIHDWATANDMACERQILNYSE